MPIEFTKWPPEGDTPRLNRYSRAENLFAGRHREVFGVKSRPFQVLRYITANFPGLLSRLAADLLAGEPADVLPANAEDETAVERLEAIVERNRFHILIWEAAVSGSMRGDAVFKLRWGPRTRPPADEPEAPPEALIEEIPASIYFPELNPDNVRDVLSVSLAWERKLKQDRFLRVEEHEPGVIRHKLFRLQGATVGDAVPLTTFSEYADLAEEEQTELEVIPVFHVPNLRMGTEHFGRSDYQGVESLIQALNNRLTQVDEVLDRHVAPKITIPEGMVDADGKVSIDSLQVIETGPDMAPPSYITWDPHLSAAKDQMDRVLELLFILTDTAPSLLGLDKYGIAESGRALRLRMIRTAAKITRKRMYFDPVLRDLLLAALTLTSKLGGQKFEVERPTLDWQDGIPTDIVEQSEVIERRRSAGNISTETSIRLLDGPEAVDQELARIAEEEAAAASLFGGSRRQREEGEGEGGEEE